MKEFFKDKKNVAIVVLVLMVLGLATGTSSNPTPSAHTSNFQANANVVATDAQLEKRLEEAQNTIRYLSDELEKYDEIEKKQESDNAQLVELQNQVQNLQTEKDNFESKLNELSTENERLQKQLNKANSALAVAKQGNSQVASQSYSTPVQTPTAEHHEEEHPHTDVVYVTNTGSKYHRDGCRYLKSKIEIDRATAEQNYEHCSVCNP